MKILVTGTAGFIGFHFTKKLIQLGHEVVGLDNINDYYDITLKYSRLKNLGLKKKEITSERLVKSKTYDNFQFIKLDLINNEGLVQLFNKEKFTVVAHLAAQAGVRYSIDHPSSYIASNLVGFGNILECCRKYRIDHLVYASSSSVYGDSKKTPFSEEDKVDHPVSLYAATKKSNELLAHAYSHLYKFQATGLRFFTVYGPWGRPDMAPMLFAKAITQNEPIKVFNHGEMQRDFTYIDDVVEGMVKTIGYKNKKKTKHQIFNIGNSKPVDLLKFIEIMEDALGHSAEKIMMPMQLGDVKTTYADTSKLRNETGYESKTDLKKGVNEFVKWYRSYYKI
ncbi:NAD-dependent epimerase/dehydratase family protein [Maribacter sp. 2210JD10-5]|uniref:NAD-dependent epimerase/dehydratase family protein n=1 Tax=Maribacter sp. 2210JD10-5 TaxID=3386272 RepID=UPI0039BD4BAF